ncbi:hypothetical protein Z043-124042 [Arapaima gigas]
MNQGITHLLPFTGSFTLAELAVCDTPVHPGLYQQDPGPAQRAYSPNLASDVDSDADVEEVMSPERAIQLWSGCNTKSRRSSGLSSRENSVLTLTDSDNDGKSDNESVNRCFLPV